MLLKKFFALMLTLCLLVSAGIFAPSAQAKEYTVYVVSNTLPVYSKVSTSSKVLGTMSFGEKMTCLATNSGWAAVRNDSGAIGYCNVNSLSTTNPNKYNTKIYITDNNVPVYRKPSTSASVMMKLKEGSSYTAVAKTTDGNWARLQNGKSYGYVQMKYISTSGESGSTETINKTVYVSANTLAVYDRASTSGKKLGTMSYGESLTMLALSGDWARVRNSSGDTGYCQHSGLTATNPNKYSTKIYITQDDVPVYRMPSTSSGVMQRLGKNESYTAVAKTTDGNWARLQNGKSYGYVQMKYISTSDGGGSVEPVNKTVYVSANTLAVYDRASTSGKKLGTMSYGESLTMLALSGDWAMVRNSSGDTGYCQHSGLTTTDPNKYSQKIYINEDNAPVYRKPTTSSGVIQRLKKNESYTAVAITSDGNWLRLKNGNSYGYLQMKYASNSPEEKPEEKNAYVSATTLKVYSGPSTSKTLLGTMSFGESLTLMAVNDSWAQVRNSSGQVGYCAYTGLTATNPNKYQKTLYAAKDGVILYSKAMTSANRVRTLSTNESIVAVALSEDGEWARLSSDGKYVYAQMKDLSTEKVPEDDSDIKDITPITVYVSDLNVAFYKTNSTQSTLLGTLSFGESLTCNGTGSGWARVINSAGTVGYCKGDGLTLSNPNTSSVTYYAQKDGVAVYKNASTSSSVLMNLSLNAKVSAVAISPDRSWLRLYNGQAYGYVEAKHLATSPVEDPTETPTMQKVVDLAMSLQGIPYVYAAQSPSEGFDCSGFTYYVYKNAAGVTLKRTAKTQGYDEKYTKITSKSDLKVGDLVFFNTVSSDDDLCDHVGIYLGNNQFIHASSGAGKVTVSSLGTSDTSYYYRTYSWARRIL